MDLILMTMDFMLDMVIFHRHFTKIYVVYFFTLPK